jgi:ELWxxDGT repeat protein
MDGQRTPRTFRRFAAVSAVTVLALLASALPAGAAEGAKLVKDIRAGSGSSNPTALTPVRGTLFFAADDGVHGQELWKSDGTRKGTKFVKDIRPGAKGSNPTHLVNVKGVLYFIADDGVHGTELWKSDGTRAGTKLVKDLAKPSPFGNGLYVYSMTNVRDRLFFFTDFPGPGVASATLCVSDGTKAGTRCLTSWAGGDVGSAVPLGGKLYFAAGPYGDPELWVSDGTKAGTRRVPGTPRNVAGPLTVVGGTLFFFTRVWGWHKVKETALWKTDGTSAGTKKLAALGDAPLAAAAAGSTLFFINGTEDAQQVWKSNGRVAGTKAVTAFGNGWVGELVPVRSRLFFTHASTEVVPADSDTIVTSTELFVTDGRPAGTTELATSDAGWIQSLTKVGALLAFVDGPEWGVPGRHWKLGRSDGTPSGTTDVASFVRLFGREETLPRAAVGGKLFFAADDGKGAGRELWSYTP